MSFFGGLAQGAQSGVQMGRGLRQEQRQQEQHELQQQADQLALEEAQREQGQARMQDTARTFHSAIETGDYDMANRVVQQNPEAFQEAFQLEPGRRPIGVTQTGEDGSLSLVIENQETGSVGPQTPDGTPFDMPTGMGGREVVQFTPDDVRRYAGLEAEEGYELVEDEQGRPVAQVGPDGRMHSVPDAVRPQQAEEQWEPVTDDQGNIVGQRNLVTGEIASAPDAMGPAEEQGAFHGLSPGDPEYQRMHRQAQDAFGHYVDTRLGEDIIGDPDFAAVEQVGREEANAIVRDLGPNVDPNSVGFASASILVENPDLRRRLNPSDAQRLAQEEEGVDSREEVEQRANEIMLEAREEFRQRLRSQFEQARGLQGGQPRGGQQPGVRPQGLQGGQALQGQYQQGQQPRGDGQLMAEHPEDRRQGTDWERGLQMMRTGMTPAHIADRRRREGQPDAPPVGEERASGLMREREGSPVPRYAQPDAARRGGGPGPMGGVSATREVQRAEPFFEKVQRGEMPEPGEVAAAFRALEAGQLTPEAGRVVRDVARQLQQQRGQ